MDSDFSNDQETPLPYFTEEAFEVPPALRAHVFSAGYALGDSWLILPHDGTDAPRHREYALRCNASGLHICMTSHADGGSSRTQVHFSEVTAIELFSALLYCELIIHRRSAGPIRIPYNGVASTAMRQLLAPLFDAAFTPAHEKSYGTAPRGLRANALLREWSGQPGASCTAVVSSNAETAVGVSADRLMLTRPSAATAANGTTLSGRSLYLVPFAQVRKAEVCSHDAATRISVAFAINLKFEASFEDADQCRTVLTALQSRVEAASAATASAATTAQTPTRAPFDDVADARAELLRLTGVELPEQEAREALLQIHRFKWIAAEKAGFDTWAMIQPGNPLRAAALHWVRKHYTDFHAAHAR